ncbi:MAG: hypothetical protein JRJ24_19705 [Deltaproteobacteria bacterium]|nr:hypothetical protein [Deltaproteobacteria bacterium]
MDADLARGAVGMVCAFEVRHALVAHADLLLFAVIVDFAFWSAAVHASYREGLLVPAVVEAVIGDPDGNRLVAHLGAGVGRGAGGRISNGAASGCPEVLNRVAFPIVRYRVDFDVVP